MSLVICVLCFVMEQLFMFCGILDVIIEQILSKRYIIWSLFFPIIIINIIHLILNASILITPRNNNYVCIFLLHVYWNYFLYHIKCVYNWNAFRLPKHFVLYTDNNYKHSTRIFVWFNYVTVPIINQFRQPTFMHQYASDCMYCCTEMFNWCQKKTKIAQGGGIFTHYFVRTLEGIWNTSKTRCMCDMSGEQGCSQLPQTTQILAIRGISLADIRSFSMPIVHSLMTCDIKSIAMSDKSGQCDVALCCTCHTNLVITFAQGERTRQRPSFSLH